MSRWSYSLFMLAVYLGTFVFWKEWPSRSAFVLGGLVAAGVLAGAMVWAARRRYFVNRLDQVLHAWVIVDVVLEAGLFEVFGAAVDLGPDRQPFVLRFHDNNNFLGCAAAFALLIGGYRWWTMRKAGRTTPGGEKQPESGAAAVWEQPHQVSSHASARRQSVSCNSTLRRPR